MPNYISNRLSFDCSPERFRDIAESLKGNPKDPLGEVDFNTVIPMPESLDIEYSDRGEEGYSAYQEFVAKSLSLTDIEKVKLEESYRKKFSNDPEAWELGKQYYRNMELYGAPNWWDWCWEHWNSPYSAYRCMPVEPEDLQLKFTTSGSPVPKIALAISEKYPDVVITYSWFIGAPVDEGGEGVFRDGQCLEYHRVTYTYGDPDYEAESENSEGEELYDRVWRA